MSRSIDDLLRELADAFKDLSRERDALGTALVAAGARSDRSTAAFVALGRTRDQLVSENERLRRILEQAKIDIRQDAEKEPA